MSRKKAEKKMFSDVGDKLAEIEQESHCPANCSIGWVYWVRLLRRSYILLCKFSAFTFKMSLKSIEFLFFSFTLKVKWIFFEVFKITLKVRCDKKN